MKAIVYEEYGAPDVLQLREVEKPVPKDNEVLVKVHAASINSWDLDLLRGKPKLYRLLSGLFKPRNRILGADIAGRVEAVGGDITQFQPGDEVFGDLCANGWGGFAEYACASEDALGLKSACMTFEQAAAIPQAGVIALQGIHDYGNVHAGQKVLINGAGGGVGTFAVQMAKALGAKVTGVDSAEKLDIMRSLGANHVIDYTREDFTQKGETFDLILDVAGYHSIFDYKRALNPEGRYVMVGGSMGRILQVASLGPIMSRIGKKKLGILVHKPNKGLASLIELFETGKIVPVIDRCYPLDEIAEAFRYFGEGHVKGKIVITIEQF